MGNANLRFDTVLQGAPTAVPCELQCGSNALVRRQSDPGDETGAILILAIAFLLVVSVIVAGLASWTMNNLNNTLQFQHAGARLYAAEGATQVALRASRYTYPANTSPAGYACPGETTPLTSINGVYVQVWCVTVIPPVNLSALTTTREVTLTACQVASASSPAFACTGSAVLLTAVVYLDDYDPVSHLNTGCTSVANETACGFSMTIVSWTPGT
jgi:hypothetical protein